jgi:hypothetical protein
MAPLPDAPTTPYDFFMQPKPTPSLIPLPANGKRLGSNPNQQNGGGSKRGFFLLIGGAIAVVFLLLGVLAFSPKDARPLQFFGLAQTQQEIIRLCNQGSSSKAKYQSTRNFAITCSTGVTTSQSQILAYMKRGNMEYDPKQIGGKANGQTDARLSQAIASSTYDDVFREIMKTRLTAYSRQLAAQLQTTTDSTGRETLAKNAKTLELISKMLADATDTTEAAPEASDQ